VRAYTEASVAWATKRRGCMLMSMRIRSEAEAANMKYKPPGRGGETARDGVVRARGARMARVA